MKILFVGKISDNHCEIALQQLKLQFPTCEINVYLSSRKIPIPKDLLDWEGDYIFSYLSQWVLPDDLLKKAKIAAINWHPAPPNYPGIGCTNFAMYKKETLFGITCHKMEAKVDSGQIIAVRRFVIAPSDTVFTITQKCYALIQVSFLEVIKLISENKGLPHSDEVWTRKPYTRRELNELCKLDFSMSEEEFRLRIKATTYKEPWAFIEFFGYKFYLNDPK